MIISGEAEAIQTNNGVEEQIFKYHENSDLSYFGELALLNNDKRVASIWVTSDEMQVAYLDKEAFESLIGNIGEILKRNQEQYSKYKESLDK